MIDLKLAICISGAGTTMEQIYLACRSGRIRGVVPRIIICSDPSASGLTRAFKMGVPHSDIHICNPKDYDSREQFGLALLSILGLYKIDLIGQYGWRCLTPANVIRAYPNRIINQHPGSLDTGRADFGGDGMYGLRVIAAALYFFQMTGINPFTEATAHFITEDEQYDKGLVIKSSRIPILADDTPESLQTRVLLVEWETQIAALMDFAAGTVIPIRREIPLIPSDLIPLLNEAKRRAIADYPKG